MMKQKKCVHVSPRSVSPNLWIDSIQVQDVHLFDRLGKHAPTEGGGVLIINLR